MHRSGEFHDVVQSRLAQLRKERAAALTEDDYAGAAWVESAMQDLQRVHRENSAALLPPVGDASD